MKTDPTVTDSRCSSIQSISQSFNPGYFSKTSQTVQEWVSDKTLDRCIAHCCRKHAASIISDLPFTVLSQRQPRPKVNVIYCSALFIEKWHDVTNGRNWIEAPSSGAAYTRPEQVHLNNRQTTVCSCGTKNLCLSHPSYSPCLLHYSCSSRLRSETLHHPWIKIADC